MAAADQQPAQTGELGGLPYLKLVLFAGVIGVPAALVAALFLALVHDLEHWLWTTLPDGLGHSAPPWYLVLGLPVVGACVVLVARRLLPGDGGHPPLEGIGVAPTPVSHAPGVALAALGTLAFGLVLGPEMPLIALGSAVGLALTPLMRLRAGSQEGRLLAGAGSFSAISALFGGPIVGGVMMVEAGAAGLGKRLMPALLPGFVAAALGYVVFVGFGDWGGLGTPGLSYPNLPAYDGTHIYDLVIAVAVGIAASVLLTLVRRLAERIVGLQLGLAGLLLGGALAVGVLAELAELLGGDSQEVLFSGQSAIPELIAEDSTKVVLVLLLAKAIGYAISLGCGFRGGPIFPAIFLGIDLAVLPVVWFDVSPTLAIAVGAAAGMAATTRMLLTPMLFAGLLVGLQGVDAVPAAVLAASAAWLTAAAIDQRAEAAVRGVSG